MDIGKVDRRRFLQVGALSLVGLSSPAISRQEPPFNRTQAINNFATRLGLDKKQLEGALDTLAKGKFRAVALPIKDSSIDFIQHVNEHARLSKAPGGLEYNLTKFPLQDYDRSSIVLASNDLGIVLNGKPNNQRTAHIEDAVIKGTNQKQALDEICIRVNNSFFGMFTEYSDKSPRPKANLQPTEVDPAYVAEVSKFGSAVVLLQTEPGEENFLVNLLVDTSKGYDEHYWKYSIGLV